MLYKELCNHLMTGTEEILNIKNKSNSSLNYFRHFFSVIPICHYVFTSSNQEVWGI